MTRLPKKNDDKPVKKEVHLSDLRKGRDRDFGNSPDRNDDEDQFRPRKRVLESDYSKKLDKADRVRDAREKIPKERDYDRDFGKSRERSREVEARRDSL